MPSSSTGRSRRAPTAVVPVGTTGESPTLTHDEHKRVVEIAIEVAKGRVPVIAGAGSNSTAEAIDLARHAKEGRRGCGAGRDAVLQQADAGRHVPALQGDRRRGRSADHHLQHPAAQRGRHERRDDGAAGQAQEHRRREGRDGEPGAPAAHRAAPAATDFCQLSGEDHTALAFLAAGGDGCISVTANVAPRLCAEMHNAWQEGRVNDAMAIQDRLVPLHDALFAETSPGAGEVRGVSCSARRPSIAACRSRRSWRAREPRCARR